MPRKRRSRRTNQSGSDRGRAQPAPRLPPLLQDKLSNVALELARRALLQRNWQTAYEFAETARSVEPELATAVQAEAAARQARRLALQGHMAYAQSYARRAVELKPHDRTYQERLRLVRNAVQAVLETGDARFFPDTVGASKGRWWELDLLSRVRGMDGSSATVPAPKILGEIRKGRAMQDVYALGIYQPFHVAGPSPLFTQYIKALKPRGQTIPVAAILLRQGLVLETDWLEEIDAVVPMATGLSSFEERGFELSEELGAELAKRLCIPFVDVLERDPDALPTHLLGDYAARARALQNQLRLKGGRKALLAQAEAILVVDDVVTHGSTLEACALALKTVCGQARFYGAALAYTETPQRRARAEDEDE